MLARSASGQDVKKKEIPTAVAERFRSKYPDVYVYEWEWKKKKKIYEADFIMKGKKYEACFTADGDWVKTKREIKKHEIPQAVWNSLAVTIYTDWIIDDLEEHSTPDYVLVYVIQVKSNKQKTSLYFLPNGEKVKSGY